MSPERIAILRTGVDVEEAIYGRRSVRKYTDAPVPEEDIRRIIQAASRAANAGNQQMWHFLIIRNKEVTQRMQQEVITALQEAMAWESSRPWETHLKSRVRGSSFFTEAPVVIAVLSKPYDTVLDSQVLPAHGLTFQDIYDLRGDPGRQSVGAAIQNMLLAAHAMGYGTCWMCGPLIARPGLERILDVTEPWRLVALVPLGVPAETPNPRPRKPVEEIVTWID
ncbi:MAG: nitroreductase family protein [Chloroflexi bacterium]|nr:nitroreductase family protein [Chloroflexota bacterium]